MAPAPDKEPILFKKKDLLLILIVLLLAAGLFAARYLNAKDTLATGYVRILADGKEYARLPLGKVQSFTVLQPDGSENVVRITENGFYMESANCHNQLCIGQGEVTTENYPLRSLGTHVLCLPNRVDVELLVEADAAAHPFLPDI